ncbi:hypothetical protein HY494_00885, partial [Candidatus Woesearchaeota archaeon]|nr:hypothetical protein [Candidatus Woesearchaeota archaeon]
YVSSGDDKINKIYSYLAYKETDVKTGKWIVYIKGNQTAGTVMDPVVIEKESAKTKKAGKDFFIWGFNFKPTNEDPRQIEISVYQKDGKPNHVGILLITRNAEGKAKPKVTANFKWPAK